MESLRDILVFYSSCQLPSDVTITLFRSGFPSCIIDRYSDLDPKKDALFCLASVLKQPEESFRSLRLLNEFVESLIVFTTDLMKKNAISSEEYGEFANLLTSLNNRLDTSLQIGMDVLEPWIKNVFALTKRSFNKRSLVEAPFFALSLIRFWCHHPKGIRSLIKLFTEKSGAVFSLILESFVRNQKHLEYNDISSFPLPAVQKEKVLDVITSIRPLLEEPCDSTLLDVYTTLFQFSTEEQLCDDVFNDFILITKIQPQSHAIGRLFRSTFVHPQRGKSESFIGFVSYFYTMTVDFQDFVEFALGTPSQLTPANVDCIIESVPSDLLDVRLLLEILCSCSTHTHLEAFLNENTFTPQLAMILVKSSRSKWPLIQTQIVQKIASEKSQFEDPQANLECVDLLIEESSKITGNTEAYRIFDLTLSFLGKVTEHTNEILLKEMSIIRRLLGWHDLNIALVELYKGPFLAGLLNSILDHIFDGQFNCFILLNAFRTLENVAELYPMCLSGIGDSVFKQIANFQNHQSRDLSLSAQKIIGVLQKLNEVMQ